MSDVLPLVFQTRADRVAPEKTVSPARPAARASSPDADGEASMGEDDFNWNDGSVVYNSRQGIAVYLNGAGDIVIRQEGDMYDPEDAFVVVEKDKARAVIAAMQGLLAEGE